MPGWRLRVSAKQVDRERGGAAERHETDRYAPGKRVAGRRCIRLRLIHLAKDDLRMAVNRMSRIGHADALLAADQKLLAEMLLQRRKLLAERRLGDMQEVRGARDAAAVDDHDEGFEASDVHVDRNRSDSEGLHLQTRIRFCKSRMPESCCLSSGPVQIVDATASSSDDLQQRSAEASISRCLLLHK